MSDEGIVYVSEPQQIAPTTEEVIDMVENPISAQVNLYIHVYTCEYILYIHMYMYMLEQIFSRSIHVVPSH